MDFSEEIREQLKTCELPPFPELTHKIIALTQDFYADPNDIADLVKMDMSLSASVLKIANSVAYGYSGKVSSITEAINRVGITAMRDLVLSVSLVNKFKTLNGIDFRQFWIHSLGVALTSDLISKHAGKRGIAKDHLYTAGLLHKVGILLLAQNFPEGYQQVLDEVKDGETELWELEKNIIGVTHMQASDFVFDNWQFPREVSDVALYYNDPVNAPEDTKDLIHIVHIANFACLNQGIGVGIDRFPVSFYDEAWENIGLKVEEIPELLEEVHETTDRAKVILEAST